MIEEKELSQDLIDVVGFPKELKEKIRENGALFEVNANTKHKKYDKNNNQIGNVIFNLDNDESIGTQKFFAMSAPILDTLKDGKVLIIDEFDASLHPMLSIYLIKLFHNKNINKKNSQLIFATHDTNLLNLIWFSEKDKYGSTDLYSLLEYKVRDNINIEKNYLQGRYGGIPYLGKFNFEGFLWEEGKI